MTKAAEFQKYIIFSLEEHNKHLSGQLEVQLAVMKQDDLVNKLKLRERGVLLIELSRQVNELRRAIISDGNSKKLPVPFGISKSSTELPRLTPAKNSSLENPLDAPFTAITKLSGSRPATTSNRSDVNSPMKAKVRPLHDKPFTAPLYHLKEEIFDIGELGYIEDKPIAKQTNFLRARHMDMFAASAGAQADVPAAEINKKLKKQKQISDLKSSSTSVDENLLFEDASVTLSWVGLDKERQAEIKTMRHQLVKELTEAARLKKNLMMATTKAAMLQGKGRALKLKIKAHESLFSEA